jgi:hypothetical protein
MPKWFAVMEKEKYCKGSGYYKFEKEQETYYREIVNEAISYSSSPEDKKQKKERSI